MARRIIEPSDFVADTAAFIDVRLPRSAGKASYSFIGPGVSQNADQTVNLMEPHGFNVGAASMPYGCINNQHLHFTAEVFICTSGRWRFNVGIDADQHVEVGADTVFSAPTWVFRGFENVGGDDGWLFTVLGGDDTGGILWSPSVLRAAAQTGLYLSRDLAIRDARRGDPIDDVIQPLTSEQLASVRKVTATDLAARVVEPEMLRWSDRALLSQVLAGNNSFLAPVIGFGMTEDRDQVAPIVAPHGFSVEWLCVEPGSSVGTHRHDVAQVLFLVHGDWEVSLNRGGDTLAAHPATGSVVSVPAGAWRNFTNVGTTAARAIIVNGGDSRTRLEWDEMVVDAARAAGWALDANGYLAPADLVGGGGS